MAENNDAPIYSSFFGVMGAASAIIFSGEYLDSFPCLRSEQNLKKIFIIIIEIEEKWSGTQVSHVCVLELEYESVGSAQTSIVRFFRRKKREFLWYCAKMRGCECLVGKTKLLLVKMVFFVVPKREISISGPRTEGSNQILLCFPSLHHYRQVNSLFSHVTA